ncbi:carbon-nitrogen hydrolase family protein [Candidatus Woesearchaeota archaeon]|nr:carbon-nitrogen hydrolase family protein [Nanoarchaeota archaeon]MCB9370996.1 carbon-nitrogen hydrolase family protein [Candidatus Woesearchaeota archaeon]USN44098.1 MAG: carbon-nitrogen hydrolase family protein [Candidatus Woesearchaeota archaeon]
MEIGFLQFDPQKRSCAQNVDFIVKKTKHLKDSVIVLPELFLSSYYNFLLIPQEQLPSVLGNLLELSKKNNVTYIGSLPVLTKFGAYNQALSIDRGKIRNHYSKELLFKHEKNIFLSGTLREQEISSFNGRELKGIIQICLDNISPLMCHYAAQNGCDILFSPMTVSIDYMRTILQARSLENQFITIFCNRCGEEKNIKYLGQSAIFFPDGSSKRVGEENGIEMVLAELTQRTLKKQRDSQKTVPRTVDF